MAEIDAKINMSLDEIIKLDRKDKKKRPNGIGGKNTIKRNMKNIGASRNTNKPFNTNFKRNMKNTSPNAMRMRNQTWRFQRRQNNSGFVGKRYRQQNGITKRPRNGINLNRNPKLQANISGGIRRPKNPKFALTRSRSRNNLMANALKNLTANKGLKRTSSLPNLRDPNSVHNRLGYQSLTQIAYRNRVKRAKKLLLQRQNKQNMRADGQMMYRPIRGLTNFQQRAVERRQQQILTTQRNINTGGLRSDQMLRSQRRAQYAQKLMRMNTARMNPNSNVNFMCTLGQQFQRPLNFNPQSNRNINNNSLRQLPRGPRAPRGRSPFRPNIQNSMPRSSQFIRRRSRSRSRSRSRQTASSRQVASSRQAAQTNVNVDDRTFSQVMYSVSNNLGVTGRTLNDRFSF